MKNAIILHGAGSNPKRFWLSWLAKNLRKEGFNVWVPQLPDSDTPNLKKQLPFILKNWKFDKETVLVGHSAGCPLILAILEEIKVPIAKAILVAGYIDPDKRPSLILKSKYNWKKIRESAREFVFINSDNDPWGCDDVQGRKMFDLLGGMLIIRHGDGHMGSDSYKQPYKQFPLLLKLILL